MSSVNTHRQERNLADLSISPIVIPVDDEKPPMPTEGIRGITEIIGKAAEFTANLAAAAKSSPIQLENVVTGNNATTPPPSQRVSGLNASQLAGIAPALNRIAAPATSRSDGVEIGKPTPKESPESPAKPTPNAKAAQPAPVFSSTSEMTHTFKRAKKKTFLEPAKIIPEAKPKTPALKAADANDSSQPVTPPNPDETSSSKLASNPEPNGCADTSTVMASAPETQTSSCSTTAAPSGTDA